MLGVCLFTNLNISPLFKINPPKRKCHFGDIFVVKMTTSSAANDENLIKMASFPFQSMRFSAGILGLMYGSVSMATG